jgi:FtsZ-binding cell division protein ZapB
MIWLLTTLALGAEIDRGPSGSIVTVRPSDGEVSCVLDASGEPLSICTDLEAMYEQSFWLVHPDAWRNAVATVTELQIKVTSIDELRDRNAGLRAENEALTGRIAAEETANIQLESTLKQKKRNHARAIVGVGLGALLLGFGGGIGLAVAL